jgi:UDP-N-acetyl-2-amino-2-deoxyglucuronate dehydrogenase
VPRRLRVGVIGCGHVARRYPAAIATGQRLVLHAVTDTDAAAGRRFAREFEAPFLPSLEAFLSSPLDLVCVCTPSDTHAALAQTCIEAGFDVVVEHPLALHPSEGERLCRVAAACDRRLYVVRQRRFLHSVQELRHLLARRSLGRVERISATLCWHRGPDYYEDRAWRTRVENGGVVRNQASHFLDVLVYLFGEPRSMSGVLGNVGHRIPVEDSFTGSIEFSDPVAADFTCTTAAARTWTRLAVSGASDDAILSGREWELLSTRLGPRANGSRAGDHADFLDRVARSLAGEPVEVVTGRDSLAELRATDALYRTARRDDERLRAVLIPLLDDGG